MFWTNTGSKSPQNSSCTATYLSSHETNKTCCRKSKSELISDVLQWNAMHRHVCVGRLIRTYVYQLFTDTRCSLEDLPRAMDNRNGWWQSQSRILLYFQHNLMIISGHFKIPYLQKSSQSNLSRRNQQEAHTRNQWKCLNVQLSRKIISTQPVSASDKQVISVSLNFMLITCHY